VRWEVQHLLAERHLAKALYLLSPRLIPTTEVARVLPSVFAEAGGAAPPWIAKMCDLLSREQRYCIGWFWQSEERLEVLTTRGTRIWLTLWACESF
jgi:hypothetical protein